MKDSESSKGVSWQRIAPLVIVAVGVLAYANSFSGAFVFDDHTAIIARIKNGNFVLRPSIRMVGDITFKINHMIGGTNTADYHATNLLIHIAAALLLFGIVRRTLLTLRLRDAFGKPAVWLALAVAVIWLAHPLQTQSVTYICQRFESLMGLFYLLTLYCVIRAHDSPRQELWHATALASTVLGVFTKESMATVPVLTLLYDRTFLSNSFGHALRKRWRLYSGLAIACSLPFLLVWMTDTKMRGVGFDMIPPAQYLATQFGVILHYLRLSFVPHPLVLDYGWQPVESAAEAVVPAIIVSSLACATAWALWKRPEAGFLGAWFFVNLAPTSSILPLADIAFEHRMYLPLAAVVACSVIGIHLLFARAAPAEKRAGMRNTAEITLFLTILAAFATMTVLRNKDYQSLETMWKDVLGKRSGNLRAALSLSSTLMDERRYEEAAVLCGNMLSILPDFSDSSPLGKEQDPAPDNRPSFERTVFARAHTCLGQILLQQGNLANALEHFNKAANADPSCHAARNNRALVLYKQGQIDTAIEEWRRILRDAPDHIGARSFLAIVAEEQRQYSEARSHYEAMLNMRPDSAFIRYQLAWLLATCPDDNARDGKRALVLAGQACEATGWKSAKALDALGAALAEAGRYDEAITSAERALQLLDESNRTNGAPDPHEINLSVADIKARIGLYQTRKPYHAAVTSNAISTTVIPD